jgi:hypothetical protein
MPHRLLDPVASLAMERKSGAALPATITVRRCASNPIIRPEMDARMGRNISGPSLIRVPAWLPNPLGRYYLYFADHKGDYIRLAVADDLAGPWRTHQPGSLQLSESLFPTSLDQCNITYVNAYGVFDQDFVHIASPDVHIDHKQRRLRMYFHGMLADGNQMTRVATSEDGIHFCAEQPLLGPSYFRVFEYDGWFYAIVMPGVLMRSRDGMRDFESGPTLFDRSMRHAALQRVGDTLRVFYSNAGDSPESILCSTIDLTQDWFNWRNSAPRLMLQPETEYEGVDLATTQSRRGPSHKRMRQLRDPAIFEEDGHTYLVYAIAGEGGLALAELEFGPN